MGFFIRPKSSTRDNEQGLNNVEAVGVVQDYEDEYIPTSGFDPADNTSGARHNRDPKRREAAPGAPLPTGARPAGAPAGASGGVRGWRGATTRNVSSGFGKGTRAGKTGVRR
ncbi:MAG: hypothetical protein GF334_01480 [Candidatus Altiarchaeales archaeon]|nr:hypothetical protein [Candidatus Altiarchaeales archaeon]